MSIFTAWTQRDALIHGGMWTDRRCDYSTQRSAPCSVISWRLSSSEHTAVDPYQKKLRCHLLCPLQQLNLGTCLITFFEDAVLVIPLLQPALLRRHLSWPADSSRVQWRHRERCRCGFREVLKYGAKSRPLVYVLLTSANVSLHRGGLFCLYKGLTVILTFYDHILRQTQCRKTSNIIPIKMKPLLSEDLTRLMGTVVVAEC